MPEIGPEEIEKAVLSKRWRALTQIDSLAADLHNFDRTLIRDPRLLVPVDVRALVVREGSGGWSEPMVRLPFRDPDGFEPFDVDDPGTERKPGVHLLWSVPSALGRGRFVDDPAAPGDVNRRRLELPVLPDRWVVLRFAVPSEARAPSVRGWVLEADAAAVTPLGDWPATTSNREVLGVSVPRDQLTAQVGGTGWTQCYDAALGRLSLHDPLDDLTDTSVESDTLAYVVAGWWSDSGDDPLDGVGSDSAYHRRLAELGWNDPDHPPSAASETAKQRATEAAHAAIGARKASRYTQPVVLSKRRGGRAALDSGYVAAGARSLRPASSGFLNEAVAAAIVDAPPTAATLLHGRIHGIPVRGAIAPDNRPDPATTRVVLGSHTTDVAATMAAASSGLAGTGDHQQRRGAERLLAAFAAGHTARLGDADVWADVEQYEHAQAFGSLPGGIEGVDRIVDRPGVTTDPGAGFRPGRAVADARASIEERVSVLFSPRQRPRFSARSFAIEPVGRVTRRFDPPAPAVPPPPEPTARDVPRPAPRFHFPAAPVAAVAGAGWQLGAAEREEASGTLVCRVAAQLSRGQAGLLAATDLLTTLGSGALPPDVLEVAREALAEDPYLSAWRTRLASGRGVDGRVVGIRMAAEAALAFSYYAADDERLTKIIGTAIDSSATRQIAVEGLQRLSLSDGVWSHPEGVTMWGQPWRPLFLDWRAELELGGLDGWELGATDLDPDGAVATPESLTITGRSPLLTGVARTIGSAIDRWLADERARDAGGHGLASSETEASLAVLRDDLTRLDLVSTALDGVREQLLGLAYDRGLLHHDDDSLADGTPRPLADALPTLLAAGRLRLGAARLVDAFGRTLDLDIGAATVAARVEEAPATLRLRPRLAAPSRWRLDLVDATSTAADAPLASVDQVDPTQQVNPIAGFLLPDHMDEALEVFAADGTPLGQLAHDAFSDAVTWEIAPGRTDVAPAAGPTEDPDARHHRVGWIAAGLVSVDATAREGRRDRPPDQTESPLSAMLRAIDTTLWTVDPFGALGSEHVAGLVGRPIAVVNARLRLDVLSDVEAVAYTDPSGLEARRGAYRDLAPLAIPVRLGELGRADDGVLGYFVDDDFTRFHVVDRVVASEAFASGRCRGALATQSTSPTTSEPITHPYVDPAGVLHVHPGQTVKLTLLMHPGGKVHLTSGILPRTSRSLTRDWVTPGLSAIAPSLRCGPLLIDPDKVRLPKVASFPTDQLFTRRDTPTSWRDDPILAATQAALLPDTAPELQEGWIRVAPDPPTSA